MFIIFNYYAAIVAVIHLFIVVIVLNGKKESVGGDEELLDFIQSRNIKHFLIMLPIYVNAIFMANGGISL